METAAIDDLRRRVDAAETRMDGFASKADLQTASDDTKRALDSMLRELRGETPQGGDQGGDTVKALAERMETIAVTYATKKELANASASLQNKQVHSSAVNVLEKNKSVSVEEVNRALAEVSAALDTKANGEALEGFVLSTQAALRGIVHESALCVGRWIWKSGITHKPHGAVPWNVESLNTDPSNFGWDRDDTVIHTAAPGLYEVTFGFFTRKKPTVRLLINGRPVLSAVNAASYVMHHSSGRLTSCTKHPDGNVTGLTLIDFLALPARAKIAITYQGETDGQGFLSLRKL